MSLPQVRLFVLNGANTNLYGLDPTGPYGALTLDDIAQDCGARAQALGATVDFRQTNHEGVLVDWIQEARTAADGIVINAGSLSYTSIALLDALAAVARPAIQVHVSNVFQREAFRHHAPLAAAVTGCIVGLGPEGYGVAVEALVAHIRRIQ
ncbi:3-dehydroquinate dehydratase [Ancylobacter dichloromethanicus]|uniref:3-dehydroquinate dehydratase n=1 Tax=Ancylobacter dichloromethanicus TaxID=518825 RepID=A0A9W6JCK1_9HYPH|nr:type II 3-dehydroquinate dehydratase [Ancylobacter dichloromethanicus]MBS7552177.1 3-dehydroquinate dehydratase [Ancylobacter dichloromethanicus]GLK73911.1 3-dehydroquinate dehydratase 1 [Ancylobacter dichloromethanicus]